MAKKDDPIPGTITVDGKITYVHVDRDTDPATLPWGDLMKPGHAVLFNVMHEGWCRYPDGGGQPCICGANDKWSLS
jgi:hypothetical protein